MEENKKYIEKCNKVNDLELYWDIEGSFVDKILWMPTIDDLIDLCRKLPDYTTDWRLHTKMRMSMQKDYCACYTKNITIKEMWLLFYMKYAHNKKWIEAKKTWI